MSVIVKVGNNLLTGRAKWEGDWRCPECKSVVGFDHRDSPDVIVGQHSLSILAPCPVCSTDAGVKTVRAWHWYVRSPGE